MGRFDGVMLLSDFDNTLLYTKPTSAVDVVPPPPVSPRNIEAIQYLIAEGGRFTVATGRALVIFRPYVGKFPMNAPVILNNGGSLYDFEKNTYVLSIVLPEGAMAELNEVFDLYPQAAAEIYHQTDLVEAVRPNQWTESHARLTGARDTEILSLKTATPPATKIIFEAERETLLEIREKLLDRGAGDRYEMFLSAERLLEITGKGVDKGQMAMELAGRYGILPEHLYCIGDQNNDLPLLRVARRAFAPENAIEELKNNPAVTTVCHCLNGAVADVIEILKERYPARETAAV